MADSDKELLELGATPHDDELKELGAISPADQAKLAKYISKPEVSKLESARAGLAAGGTFGFAPRIGAAGGALASAAQQGMSGEPQPQSLQDLYNEYLKYNQQRQETAKTANPITYGGAEFAGAMASPMNKIAAIGGPVAKEAPIVAKMAHGALKGTEMGLVAGAAQSPDLTDPQLTARRALEAGAMGGTLGAALPPVGAVVKAAAGGTANMLRPLIGKPVQNYGKGLTAGKSETPNLAGEPGQLQAVEARGKFAEKFVQDLHQILSSNAKNKRELIANALANSQLAPEEAVQAVTQKYLDANPQLNEESARKELAQIKEMILTAREGPQKTETVRQYTGAAAKRPLPSAEPQVEDPTHPNLHLEDEPSITQNIEQPPQVGGVPAVPPMPGAPSNLSVPSAPYEMGTAQRMPEPAPTSPSDFQGYEAVHKATIDPADDEARAAFQHKIHEKLADEKALGKNFNDNPVQIEEHPIPDSDKVRLVAKRAVQADEADAFKEQAANIANKQREDIRLQALLDKQNEMRMQMQQQQEAEMAKPQFEDVQQTTREGGRNLQNPEELYRLQQLLSQKSKINPNNPGAGFSSPEMQQMSGQAAKDIAGIIKQSIPGMSEVDQKIFDVNNLISRIKAKKIFNNMSSPDQGTAEAARQDASKKILNLLSPRTVTDKGQLNQNTINDITSRLQKIDPTLADTFQQEATKHIEAAETMSDLIKPETVGGGGPVLSSIRRGLNKTAYNTGYGIGTQINKTAKYIEPIKQTFQQYTPDALRSAASGAAQSSNQAVQQLGQVLSKLATADERTRNSMMFVLQQQHGFRQLMAPYFPNEEAGTPQAKDKSLEKYK